MIEFILGIMFVALGIPILQSIADMITGLAQWFIAFCSAHISQYNKYVNDLQANERSIAGKGKKHESIFIFQKGDK